MNYFIFRNGQESGPYSLADLQRMLANGEIQPGDQARSEALAEWSTVQQVAGNIAVAPAQPGPVNYGQVPVYAEPSVAEGALRPEVPIPPGLHWGWVLGLSLITCGIFSWIWMFVQAAFVRRISGNYRALVFYSIGITLMIGAGVAGAGGDVGANGAEAGLQLLGAVCLITGHFTLKSALEEYYNNVDPFHLVLSGPMTFFFNTVYFQYHLSAIREWKLSQLSDRSLTGIPSGGPRADIIYTPSELDAMRNPPPGQ